MRALQLSLRDLGVVFRLGETVEAVERHESGALIMLESGKRIAAETVLYSAGRQGATARLGLERIGVEADERGQIKVDEHYRTTVDGIYAVGDVIGFPALAATAMEQGRIAALSALGRPTEAMGELLPIGIYSIPEISFVGQTEEELTEAGVPYEVGVSRYRELARGQILGDSHGMLKLLVSLDDRTLLGVHILGTGATELVHIGQVAMGNGATVDYLVGTVFNYPTLAEAYKVAALDAQNRLQALTDSVPCARRTRVVGVRRGGGPRRGPGGRRWGEYRILVLHCGGWWGKVVRTGRSSADSGAVRGNVCSSASSSNGWTTRTASRCPPGCGSISRTASSAPAGSTAASRSGRPAAGTTT